MFKLLFCGLFALVISLQVHAQNDTLYRYFSQDLKEVAADSAYTVMKMVKQNEIWLGTEVYAKSRKINSEGLYTAADAKIPIGRFKNYKEDGKLFNVATYTNGKLSTLEYFYTNGSKLSMIAYLENGTSIQKGWDENGKEIKNFVVEREARFKGGPEGWRKFMEKTLNANVAADAGAPAGTYNVKVQFVINKEGFVSNVKALSTSAACRPCASEAVNAISVGPQWEPAIQNNVPVIYRAIQEVTFVVEETKSRKKRG